MMPDARRARSCAARFRGQQWVRHEHGGSPRTHRFQERAEGRVKTHAGRFVVELAFEEIRLPASRRHSPLHRRTRTDGGGLGRRNARRLFFSVGPCVPMALRHHSHLRDLTGDPNYKLFENSHVEGRGGIAPAHG